MNEFRRIVEESVQRLSVQYHPVQGFIPRGGIDFSAWTCTVRVPDQHQGMVGNAVPGGGSFLEYHHVPLPRQWDGLIHSPSAKVLDQECGVLVGFRGSELFPYIIQFLDLLHTTDGKERANVQDRESVVLNNFLTDGPAATPGIGGGGFDLPPTADALPDLPPAEPQDGPVPYGFRPSSNTRAGELALPVQQLLGRFFGSGI